MSGGLNIIKFLVLYPLSLIYGIIIALRNGMYNSGILKSKSYDFPVICIGNLSVGGTGKTPHVEYLIRLLQNDFGIAVLSRGYKRKTRGFRFVETSDDVHNVGDEPLQIKKKFPHVTVAVDEKRIRGINKLSQQDDLRVVLLDDAFQHRKVNAGLNILLSNYDRPFTKDHFLPFGTLREHPHEHRRAHIIIITKCPIKLKPIEKRIIDKELKTYPFQYLFFTSLEYGNLTNIFDEDNQIPIDKINKENTGIIGVSAIAHNKKFKNKLKELSEEVKMVNFLDHHYYNKKDIERINHHIKKLDTEKKIIVTTEKDAVKIRNLPHIREDMKALFYYLPIRAIFLGDEKKEDEFKQQIIRYVKTNRRYSKLYKGQDHLRS
ncbi:MAG: tetraacyldisaccharide 4'-kinase [Bacteroidota bacterium]|nr:tetraacyldisaccharide 4'-kinase [Bacteroidota bacterium]